MPELYSVSSVPMEEKHGGLSWLTAVKRVFGCPHKDAAYKTPKKCKQYNHEEEEESKVRVAAKPKVEVIRLKTPQSNGKMLFAAIAIQTAFRAHLAKRAVGALKGIVKLQALIRGQNVRRQAQRTLKCMHALLRVQAMMNMKMMMRVDDEDYLRCPARISHHSARKPIFAAEPPSISHTSIWKISTGAPTHGRNNSSNTIEMEDLKANFRRRLQELSRRQRPVSPGGYQKPIGNSVLQELGTQSTLKSRPAAQVGPASPRSSYSAANTPFHCPAAVNLPTANRFSVSGAGREPNYMAATESAKARVRSQSAPRPRPSTPRAEMERRGPAKKCLCYSVQNPRAGYGGIEQQSVRSGNTDSAGGEISPCSTTQLRCRSRIPR